MIADRLPVTKAARMAVIVVPKRLKGAYEESSWGCFEKVSVKPGFGFINDDDF